MDFKQIQELVKLVNKSNISELKIEQEDIKLTIKQKDKASDAPQYVTAMPALPQMVPAATSPSTQGVPPATPPSAESGEGAKTEHLITITSPMIGTFYRSASPDKPTFVNVGDEVVPGKVVCIIEAMKLFNEIESEVSGRIVKMLVDDASPVEYDQPLFLVDPS